MRIPDPKSLVKRFKRPRSTHTFASLTEELQIIEAQLSALRQIEDRIDSREFRWLVEEYLPAESLRIGCECLEVDPLDPLFKEKMTIAAGQKMQNNILTEKLNHVKTRISQFESRKSSLMEARENIQRKKTQDG